MNALATAFAVLVAPACAFAASGLYDVAVPIADRSPAARAAGAREGLEAVLVRVTGRAPLPDTSAVRSALARAQQYAMQFGFEDRSDPATGAAQTWLTLRFSDASVRRLVEETGLPLWSTDRPRVVLWVAADVEEGRRVLAAADEHPLVEAIETRAQYRALPLVLPAVTLEEEGLGLGAEAEGAAAALDRLAAASERYGAFAFAAASIEGEAGGPLHARGLVHILEEDTPLAVDAATPEEAAALLVDAITDAFVARFSVAAGSTQALEFDVDGVAGYRDYAGVLEYLRGLEYVDSARPLEVAGSGMRVAVVTRTPWEQLRTLLDLGGRLVTPPELRPDPAAAPADDATAPADDATVQADDATAPAVTPPVPPPPMEMRLVWQGNAP